MRRKEERETSARLNLNHFVSTPVHLCADQSGPGGHRKERGPWNWRRAEELVPAFLERGEGECDNLER